MPSPQPPASSSRPFAAAPDVNRYFPSAAMEEARLRIGRSILRGEGPVLVIGATGLGKTLLLHVLGQQFGKELVPVHLMGGQLVTRRALLQMTLFQLGLPYREMDESELRLALLSHLQPTGQPPMRILMMVDEADALPPRLLEELRSLTNLCVSGQMQVNLVLAGNSKLEEQFADPKLELFSQRVAARCYLSAFGREESFQFVRAQVAAVGHEPQTLFSDDALEAIFAATDGVPRLINQLGDQLMWMVQETGIAPLDELIVQQAWSELQQLPAPWNTQDSQSLGGDVEFGELCADDVVVDEVVFEDDEYVIEEEDDLPASIPISMPQAYDAEVVEYTQSSDLEAIDVTEDLMQQLNELDRGEPPAPKLEVAPALTPNPFAETFESEEIVLDRYSAFESLLLAEAPRVENLKDTSFSQQLQDFETVRTELVRLEQDTIPDVADAEEPYVAPVSAEAAEPVTLSPAEDSNELLVIEESATSDTTVVSGQKFRQLFSSLELANQTSCFG